MNTYNYSAKNKNGNPVLGTIEAVSETEAAEILHKKELIVLSIAQAKSKNISYFKRKRKVKPDDLAIFSRQLATMIDGGMSLVYALGVLGEQVENKGLREIVITVRQDIEAGMSFCDALAKHPQAFSELFVNMAKAGESSGMLDEVLNRLADYLEKSVALTRKIRSSLIYPAVIVGMALIITAVLLLKVVPTFKGIFDILGSKLPLPTQILIGVSDVFRKNFLYLVIVLAFISFVFKKYINTPSGRYNFDLRKLQMPVLGTLFKKLAIARFSRTFSTLTKSGVSVLSGLEIVSKTAGNKVVEGILIDCSKTVREGEPLSKPLSKNNIFPPMVCRMISVGEQTGQLEKMLSKIADFYDEQVDAAAAALTSMIEPLVIGFLGIVIGGIVIALFLPIFKISEIISK